MNRSIFFGFGLFAAFFAAGCNDDTSDPIFGIGARGGSGDSLAAEGNTRDHMAQATGGENGITEPAVQHAYDAVIGSPEVVARTHGAQKVSYAMLGAMLTDFGGLTGTTAGTGTGANNNNGNKGNGKGGTTTATTPASLYSGGMNALGAPVYASRVPELIVPSTSSLAKEFDIFMAAAPSILTGITGSKRCPGVALVQNNQFTKDGLSCLMGKPAKDDHVSLANQIVTSASSPTIGQQIAVATLLAATHISE